MASRTLTKSPLRRAPQLFRSFLGCGAEGVSGSVAIEFGLIVPILALMLIAGADLGMGIYRKMQVENAAQAGAEYVAMHGFHEAAISTAVMTATSFTGISPSPPPVRSCGCATNSGSISAALCSDTCPGGSPPGMYATVSAQGNYSPILPYPAIIANSNTFTARSTVRVQ